MRGSFVFFAHDKDSRKLSNQKTRAIGSMQIDHVVDNEILENVTTFLW